MRIHLSKLAQKMEIKLSNATRVEKFLGQTLVATPITNAEALGVTE